MPTAPKTRYTLNWDDAPEECRPSIAQDAALNRLYSDWKTAKRSPFMEDECRAATALINELLEQVCIGEIETNI